MKIGIDISQIAYEGTGVAQYTSELVRNLISNDSTNSYKLIGFNFGKREYLARFCNELTKINNNVTFRIFPYPEKLSTYLWNDFHHLNLSSLIGPLDVFHSSDWTQPPICAKTITTIHDMIVYRYPETSHPYIVKTQKKRLSLVKRECNHVIADSKATKTDIIDYLQIHGSNISVVYPGIDKRFFSPSLSDIEKVKKRYNLKSNYILSVGTLEPRKNIKRVLKAFERFKEHRLVKDKGPVELILVGREGWGTDYKLSQSVRSLGFVPDNFLPALYKNARLFVYPSLYEGFGFPVLEAMAAECPVLTSDRGSLKEISGNSAILVDPEDVNSIAIKMVQGYIDTAFRSDITSHAKQHAEQFSWSKAANLIRNIYESLVR